MVGLLGWLACMLASTQEACVGAHKTSEAKASKLDTPSPPSPPHSPPAAPNPPQLPLVDPKLSRDQQQPNNVVRAGLQVIAFVAHAFTPPPLPLPSSSSGFWFTLRVRPVPLSEVCRGVPAPLCACGSSQQHVYAQHSSVPCASPA